jgi:hypothetical protein
MAHSKIRNPALPTNATFLAGAASRMPVSYQGGDGTGKDVPPEPRRRSVPSEAAKKDSDGYLESTRTWANLPEAGGDSGVGRLEKAGKR